MDKPKYITHYFAEQRKELEKHFPKARDEHDEDAIHDMRVAIKRLRALFLLLEYLSEHSFSSRKNYKFFKKMFKPSGKIRDIQLQKKIIKEAGQKIGISFDEYLDHLTTKQEQSEENFINEMYNLELEKIGKIEKRVNKTVKKLSGMNIKKKAFTYLENKFGYIVFLSKKPADNEKWHEIRTHVKQALYITELMITFFEPDEKLKGLKKQLKNFGTTLGDWHDYDVAHENLKAYIHNNNIPYEQRLRYRLLLNQILEEGQAEIKE